MIAWGPILRRPPSGRSGPRRAVVATALAVLACAGACAGSAESSPLGASSSLQVTPGSGFAVAGAPGGPFTPRSAAYALVNSGVGSVDWSAVSSAPWLRVSPAGGTLAAGTQVVLDVEIDAAQAGALAPGPYVATVTIHDLPGGGSAQRTATLGISSFGGALTVTPRDSFESGGPRGGPFAPAGTSYVITNWSGSAVDWSAQSGASWIRIVPSSGTLGAGQAVSISVDVDGAIAAGLRDGHHTDTLTVQDDDAGTIASRLPLDLWVGVAVEDGAWLRVNGAKFFPIFVWDQPPQQAWVDFNSGLGINTHLVPPSSPSANAGLLDMLQAKGMYGVLSFDPTVVDHPALLAWITSNEPFANGLSPALVQQEVDAIRAVDPDRLVMTGFSSAFYWDASFGTPANEPVFQQYTAIPDLVGFGHYPVAEWSQPGWVYMAGTMVSFLHDVYLERSKPVWELVEALDFRGTSTSQGPTAAQVRFEAWDAILHGATAIGYHTIAANPSVPPGVTPAVEQELRRTNAQIAALTDVLLSTPPEPNVTASASGGLAFDYALRQSGSTLYLFAANADMGYGATSITFGFDRAPTSVKVHGESRTVAPVGNTFTDAFAPLDVHVYEIEGVLPAVLQGVWTNAGELAQRPTAGAAWQALLDEADRPAGTPNVSDQDDDTDVRVLAKALVYARTGIATYRTEVIDACLAAVGTEVGGRTLALGRNLVGYVIAADLVGLPQAADDVFRPWLRACLSANLSGRTLRSTHEDRPNNWGTHAGASRAAVAVYLGDTAEIERCAQVFRGWLGDRGSYAGFDYGALDWQADPLLPVGINPLGATKNGFSIDGVLPDDQRRGGGFVWPPPRENYVWEALQGALVQAVILHRAGHDTWEWEDRALLRAVRWLHDHAGYPAEGDDTWQPHLVNHFYATGFPAPVPSRPGKNLGWTDWTHPPPAP